VTLRITIDVFSGRPNPVIELRGKEAAAVLERLTPGRQLKGREARVPPPTLGYRGLVIEQIEERKRRLRDRISIGTGGGATAAGRTSPVAPR
jgi:hypothetical protein